MKKQVLKLLVLSACTLSMLKAQTTWNLAGNSLASTNFLGSTNNIALLFKVNNTNRARINTNGTFQIFGLTGNGNRLMMADPTGNLLAMSMGTPSQVLYGNGTWGSLPSVFWTQQTGTNNIYFPNSVGIGTTAPQYGLDVTGTARVTSSLRAEGNLDVLGTTNLSGSLKLSQALELGNFAIRSHAATQQSPAVLRFGTVAEGPQLPIALDPCLFGQVNVPLVNSFSGLLSANTNLAGIGNITLDMGSDGAHGIIESRGTNQTNPGSEGLLLNYYCGQNIYMCTGTNYGYVSVGRNFEVGAVSRDVNTAINISGRPNMRTALFTSDQSADYGYNTQFKVNRNLTKAISVFDNGATVPMETFVVMGNGATSIIVPSATSTPDALTVTDGATNAINFKVKSNGFVYAREVTIQTGTFPDYVFAPDYKLMKLPELETFIKNNKHLPGFKSESEYVKNGMNSGELLIKQQEKIEELTLYIIELEKRLKKVEDGNK